MCAYFHKNVLLLLLYTVHKTPVSQSHTQSLKGRDRAIVGQTNTEGNYFKGTIWQMKRGVTCEFSPALRMLDTSRKCNQAGQKF